MCFCVHSAPISQSYKNNMDVAAHCLKLPGSYLNVSTLLDKKKFRSYGHEVGALAGFQLLQNDDLGKLEHCGGHGAKKVFTDQTIVTVCMYIHTMCSTGKFVASSPGPFLYSLCCKLSSGRACMV